MDVQMMNAIDPIASLLNKFDNYCNESQAAKFEAALDEYNRCTGESLADFIETLLPAAIGASMTCAPYFYETMTEYEDHLIENPIASDLLFQKECPIHVWILFSETTPSEILSGSILFIRERT